MIKVGELVINQDIAKMKENSLLELSKETNIQTFFKTHQLDTSLMKQFWVELLDYRDDYKMCENCQGIEMCQKASLGMKKLLDYRDGMITVDLKECEYSSSLSKRRDLLSHYSLFNVKEELLLTDLYELDLVNKGKYTPNERATVTAVLKYCKEPASKGLFIHGLSDDKTKILAALMRELAKGNKEIAFINYPAYLIDTKKSFSSDTGFDLDELLYADYLVLDGIGEENVTQWSRDEILLTVLSYRLLNELPTFMTSIYDYNDLIKIYKIKGKDDLKYKVLISKMKALMDEYMLDD